MVVPVAANGEAVFTSYAGRITAVRTVGRNGGRRSGYSSLSYR
jgi:hypothetical protein